MYRCVVNQRRTIASHAIDLQELQNQNGLSTPTTVNVMPRGQFKVACKYIQDYLNATKSWACYNKFPRQNCTTDFEVVDDRSRSELVLSVAPVTTSDNKNIYTCKVDTSDGDSSNLQVTLIVGLKAPGLTRNKITKSKARTPTKTLNDQSHLLLGIICLLAIIAIILVIILLKLYCKRHKDRVQSPSIGGGTFHMNDPGSDLPLANLTPLQPSTGCMDDSSSTSSESSGHSFGNISFGPQHQYLSIAPSPKIPDYENVLEGMPSALPDYENVTAATDQDYVNIPEPQDTPSTEDKDTETERPAEEGKESTASRKKSSSGSSESSSSDESEEESVNYSQVVFKKGTE